MQGRTRIFILLLLIVVIVAVVAVVLLGNNTDEPTNDTPVSTEVGVVRTQPPTATDFPTPTPTEATQIVIAVQAIPRGAVIRPEMVALRDWPADAVPFNAIRDTEEVIGLHARTDLFIEQPILVSMAVPDLSDLAEVGSDVAAIIPQGRVAVAVPMDRLTSVAYAIQPGDHVDIIVSMLFLDIDNDFQSALPNEVNLLNTGVTEGELTASTTFSINGRIETERIPLYSGCPPEAVTCNIQQIPYDWPALIAPSEAPRPRLATQRTILDALVLWVGDFPFDGRIFRELTPTPAATPTVEGEEPPIEEGTPAPDSEFVLVIPPDIVTLAVTPQQAVILTYMIEAHIPLTFALRAAADTSQVPTDQVTLDYIMAEYNMTVPIKQDFAIEPAIRSIRQTFVGSEISLGESPGLIAEVPAGTVGGSEEGSGE